VQHLIVRDDTSSRGRNYVLIADMLQRGFATSRRRVSSADVCDWKTKLKCAARNIYIKFLENWVLLRIRYQAHGQMSGTDFGLRQLLRESDVSIFSSTRTTSQLVYVHGCVFVIEFRRPGVPVGASRP
jgi:hypothetical protein